VASAPNDKKVRRPRCLFQHQGWVTLSDDRPDGHVWVSGSRRRMSRPAWNLGDGPEQLSYAATSSFGA
jgi:hypothetical protein